MEKVGDIGHRPDDVVILGKCDEVVRRLCRELGWEEDLDSLWAATEIGKEGKKKGPQGAEETVDDLVDKIGATLVLDNSGPEDKSQLESSNSTLTPAAEDAKVIQGEAFPEELAEVMPKEEETNTGKL
jgi:NAD+-dependent protein deacetylase SIR2